MEIRGNSRDFFYLKLYEAEIMVGHYPFCKPFPIIGCIMCKPKLKCSLGSLARVLYRRVIY